MNQLFLLGASLCAGSSLALSGDVMKFYRVVNQSDRSVMVNIGAPKAIRNGEVVSCYYESFLLDSGLNNLKSGQIKSFYDPALFQDFFYIEASSSLVSFSPLYSPRYETFNASQYHDSIYCVIDHQVNVNCTFHSLSY